MSALAIALGVTAGVAALLAWLVPVAYLLHRGADPTVGAWRFTAAALVWFLGGVFVIAYGIAASR